jgi:hypothetical protein
MLRFFCQSGVPVPNCFFWCPTISSAPAISMLPYHFCLLISCYFLVPLLFPECPYCFLVPTVSGTLLFPPLPLLFLLFLVPYCPTISAGTVCFISAPAISAISAISATPTAPTAPTALLPYLYLYYPYYPYYFYYFC